MERLSQALSDEVDGKRTCVLVLGDGVNQEAAGKRGSNDWQRVLSAVWREAGGSPDDFDPTGKSTATLWSHLVRQWAAHRGAHRTAAELAIRGRVAARLRATLENGGRGRRLLSKLVDGRFANLISFSIDRRLALGTPSRRIVYRRPREGFLFRHVDVTGPRGRTKVWFPYGDSGSPSSIELDHSTYDGRLVLFEESRARLMDTHNSWDGGYGPGLRPPQYVFDHSWSEPQSWFDLFMCAPLVFVGASLPDDDWPLWWLLHQRARYFVPFKKGECAETFYLTTSDAETHHIQNGAAGLEMVTFSNHAALWKFVLSAVEAPGADLRAWADRRFRP
jgi:hypothetical protein